MRGDSFCSDSPSASLRTPANTRKPRRSRSSAIALPMPVDEPVTRTFFMAAPSQLDQPRQALAVVGRVAAERLQGLHPAQVQVHVVLPREADPAVDLHSLAGEVAKPVAA